MMTHKIFKWLHTLKAELKALFYVHLPKGYHQNYVFQAILWVLQSTETFKIISPLHQVTV